MSQTVLIILFTIAMIGLCILVLGVYLNTVHGYEPRIITPYNEGKFDHGTVLKGMDICSMGEYSKQDNCSYVPQGVKIPISELNYIGVVS